MRRKDREVTQLPELIEIVKTCKVCRLAMNDAQGVYIVPLNFGYELVNDTLTLYFHSAAQGRKIDALAQSQTICFEMDCGHELIEAEKACGYGYAFKSIIGYGNVTFCKTPEAVRHGLTQLMQHQASLDTKAVTALEFDEKLFDVTAVFKLEVTQMTGKWRK